MDIKNYKPGRFAYLMDKPFAQKMWQFLAAEERVDLMLSATTAGKPAIAPFLDELESRFGEHLDSSDYPDEEIHVLANNMIKQIMDIKGYEHLACGLCPQGRFIKMSGLYQKKGSDIT